MQVPTGAQAVGTRTPVRLVAVAAGVLVVDQASKAWALAALDDGPVNVVGDAVRFRLVRNTGGAFSLFSGLAPALAILATVLVVVVFRMGRAEDDRMLATGLALVFGGALGNLSDRVFREPGFLEGAVVDFVDVGPWPTFNVADTAIVVGALALVLFRNRSGRAQADP